MRLSRLSWPCAIWLSAALLLAHTGLLADAEAPESKHRQACFHLDAKRLAQTMWLQGTLSHRVPSGFSCSSLQGAACMHGQSLQHRLTDDLGTALRNSDEASHDGDASTKVKLVLLKPGDGQGFKELLKKTETSTGVDGDAPNVAASRDQQQAAQQLLEDSGEVVFEGDPASLSALDSIMQTTLAVMGIPETDQFANTLRRQLAKSLTEAEFAEKRSTKPKADAADVDSKGESSGMVLDDGSEIGSEDGSASADSKDTFAGSELDVETQEDDVHAAQERILLSYIRAMHKKHAGTAAAGGGQQPSADAAPANQQRAARPALDQEPAPEAKAEAAQPAPDEPQKLLAGQPRRRSGPRGGGQRHSSSRQRRPQAADAAGGGASDAPERVYIDEETSEQFVLPDEQVPEGEERVYVDDRTGHTYVVTDDGGGAGSSGHSGRLSRRLSDDMAWLDGLTDEQYQEYMDNYYDELDRDDAARENEEEQRQSAEHVDL